MICIILSGIVEKHPKTFREFSGVKISFSVVFEKSAFNASLSCRFRLLLSSYGRFFVMLFFTKIADDTVARAFTFESAKRVVERFVFSDSDSRHIHNPPLPERRLMITRKLYQTNLSVSSDFGDGRIFLFSSHY